MTPDQLQPEQFKAYPPEAKLVVTSHLPLLRELPTSYVALLLREAIAYDWKFPAERAAIDSQLSFLSKATPDQIKQYMAGFAAIKLSNELARADWVNAPLPFSEQLSAHLWATHQIDSFHAAATAFVHQVDISSPPPPPPAPRLSIVVIGRGVTANNYPLFRKLRPYGTHFTGVTSEDGCRILLSAVCARAAAHPGRYLHWYVDGGEELAYRSADVTCISYQRMQPIRAALLKRIKDGMEARVGSEMLRTSLAETGPEQLGLSAQGADGLINRFQISLLTEGSGTQIYATTFVQWTARELLRRAQPVTLFARFAPRQRERSMEQMLEDAAPRDLDVNGSLIDADMGAYYTWINQVRLPGFENSGFLAWFEGHGEALAIGPGIKRGKVSGETIALGTLVQRVTTG